MSRSRWQVSGEKRPHGATWCYIRGNGAIGVGADAPVGQDVCVPKADCMVGNILLRFCCAVQWQGVEHREGFT